MDRSYGTVTGQHAMGNTFDRPVVGRPDDDVVPNRRTYFGGFLDKNSGQTLAERPRSSFLSRHMGRQCHSSDEDEEKSRQSDGGEMETNNLNGRRYCQGDTRIRGEEGIHILAGR